MQVGIAKRFLWEFSKSMLDGFLPFYLVSTLTELCSFWLLGLKDLVPQHKLDDKVVLDLSN